MRNLLLFIRRFYPILLFLLLEVIAIILISRSNAYQGATFVNSSNRVTGSFYQAQHNVADYFNLREINDRLERENAALRTQINRLATVEDTGRVRVIGDKVWQFLPATVINHTVHKKRNYFTLDKGASDSVRAGMGVIDDRGVVGMITNVSGNYSVGLSMLNSKTRISVRLKDDGKDIIGILRWKGTDILTHMIEDITKTANIAVGDTFMTSGYSTYFPVGIPVAHVTRVNNETGGNFSEIEAELTNNILSIDRVTVVAHLGMAEVDSLENTVE
jgi:rod shape-determining protein MreC